MMAWLLALFQYECTSNETEDLKETKGGHSLTLGSSSLKFLAKEVYMDSIKDQA